MALIAVILLATIEPFGPDIPSIVYWLILLVTTMFGVWEGGLFGVEKKNKKLERFNEDIEAGKYLVLIYAFKDQEEKIKEMMTRKHPESALVAIDKHFINPFPKLERVQSI